MTTLRTDLRDPNAPAPLARWHQLWRGDGAPNAGAWEGLAGPPGVAAGDSYPTRPGDRAHPAPPPTVDVPPTAEAVYLFTPRPADSRVAELFAPGAAFSYVEGAGYRRGDDFTAARPREGAYITPAGGARRCIGGRYLPHIAEAPPGAWVIWRVDARDPWRPGMVV